MHLNRYVNISEKEKKRKNRKKRKKKEKGLLSQVPGWELSRLNR